MTPCWVYDDGGRAAAGYRGTADDCVTRAIVIATGTNYRDVYTRVAAMRERAGKPRNARNGVPKSVTREAARYFGLDWTPTMRVGQGCRVHLRAEELPAGRLVVSVSRHVVAVIDGVIHDTHDPSRDGMRYVYGYWTRSV